MLTVRLASTHEPLSHPCFEVVDPESTDRPRYHTLEVREDDNTVLWRITDPAVGDNLSVTRVCYGDAVPGFNVTTPPSTLGPALRHTVYVFSLRNRGALHFSSDRSDGPAHAVP